MTEPGPEVRYRVVIIDDEPLARAGLAAAIARLGMGGIAVAAQCENGFVGLERIRALEPEILLLDIAMPVLDGFAMLERLEPEAVPPVVIFVTAYDEHAVRAFAAEAVDFLVKPVADARLRAALERATRRISEARALRAGLDPENAAATTPGVGRYLQQLVIPERGRQVIVPVTEIEWIEADTY